MNDYPLSAKSSKKVNSSHSQFKNSLLKKSACQNADTLQLSKKDYQHILLDEKIFLEIYYNGVVTQTAYDRYISFMGGTVYKRLNSKVNIFITNSDEREIAPILDRVKKTCSNCKVINILWIQQCFRQKKKVPFEEFVINARSQKIQEEEGGKNQKIQQQLQQFLKNIGEDIHNDFKQFSKTHQNPYFQVLNKNHNIGPEQIFLSTVFDLPPNKKQREKQEKQEKPGKKRKCSIKVQKVCKSITEGRQFKSTGVGGDKKTSKQVRKEQQTPAQQQILLKHQDIKQNKLKNTIISNLMQKYLISQNIRQEDDLTKTIENMDIQQVEQIVQIMDTASKGDISVKSKFYSEVFRKSKRIQMKKRNKVNSQCDSKLTFSSRGSYYKNIPIKLSTQLKQIILDNNQQKAQQLNTLLSKKNDNRLIIISNSKSIAQKIKEINQKGTEEGSIQFQLISMQSYLTFLSVFPSNSHQFLYLLNPKKIEDRVLYFYLSINNKSPPLLVNCRLMEEIQTYNKRLKDPCFKSPLKIQKIRFRFMSKIQFFVNKKQILNKKIVFLQSSFDKEILKKVISEVGGILITQQEYLMGKSPDLIITNKFGLPEKGVKTLKEDELWSLLLNCQGDLS